jgi:hypothetical protein
MKLAGLAVVAVLFLGACSSPAADADVAQVPTPTAPATSASATSGLGSVKDEGTIPDPCTLLSKADVADLTGRQVSQMDEDGQDGQGTRYCQWQQPSGQLDVFLSRTTEADFKIAIADAQPVDGVGEDAFSLSGHLYVLYGTVSIDVYSRGDSDEKNLAVEKQIAKVLIPKI